MKEHIEELAYLAELLYKSCKGKNTIDFDHTEDWQNVIRRMQKQIFAIQKELLGLSK